MHRRVQAIVLLLIGLTGLCLIFTVVVKVRDAANQIRCSDNLHQIVMVSHKYHEDYKCLPPGYVGPWPDRPGIERAPHVGVLVYLLPYLTKEEKSWEPPYYQADLDALTDPSEAAQKYQPPADQPWWKLTNPATKTANSTLAKKQFSFLKCPSAPDDPPEEGLIVALHAFGKDEFKEGFLQREMIKVADDPSVRTWGTTHYLGIMGRFGKGDQFEGVFTNRSKLTLHRISVGDGISMTLGFGEALGGLADFEKRQTTYSWFCGSLPTYYGLPDPPSYPWYAFNGPHARTVNFAFMDGHVSKLKRDIKEENDDQGRKRFVHGSTADPKSTSWLGFQSLAGYRDGMNPWAGEDD